MPRCHVEIFPDKKISLNGSTEFFGPSNENLLSSDGLLCLSYDKGLFSGWFAERFGVKFFIQ